MALCDQLRDWPLVQRAGDEQDDVVDHVGVGDEVQEGGQLARGVVPHVLELGDELLAQVVVDDGDLEGAGDGGQEVAVVRALEVQLQVCKRRDAIVQNRIRHHDILNLQNVTLKSSIVRR